MLTAIGAVGAVVHCTFTHKQYTEQHNRHKQYTEQDSQHKQYIKQQNSKTNTIHFTIEVFNARKA